MARDLTSKESWRSYAVGKMIHRLVASEGKGPVARRNARKAMRAEIRRLERFVDEHWPAPAPKPKKRRKVTEESLRAAGFVLCTADSNRLLAFTAAGVRTRKGPKGNPWVQAWALELPPDAKTLKAARLSVVKRKALLAQHRIQREARLTPP